MTKTLYLRKAAMLVACCFFSLFSFGQQGFPPPAIACEFAVPLCNGELESYTGTLPLQPNPTGPLPLCNGGFVPNNTSWFSFVAGTENLAFQISYGNCQNGPGGMQVGIISECVPQQEMGNYTLVCAATCPGGNPITIVSGDFIPGKAYYMWLDGCAGTSCEYNIQLIEGSTYIDSPPVTPPIIGPSSVCAESSPTLYESLPIVGPYEYVWTVEPPVPFYEEDNFMVVEHWPTDGLYEICMDAINPYCYPFNQPQCISVEVVNTIPPTFIDVSYCEDDLGCFHEGVFYTAGFYEILLVASNGCDSTIFLNVTEIPIPISDLNATICFGESYVLDGQIYTLPVVDALIPIVTPNPADCDSFLLFNLDVLGPEAFISGPPNLDCALGVSSITLFSGGNNPYHSVAYQWETPDGLVCDGQLQNQELEVCAAGEYCLTVTVSNEEGLVFCEASTCRTITEASAVPVVSLTTTPATCGTTDGSIQASVTGSVPPYTFAWEGPNGPITQTDQLPPGNYTVTVTAANGCQAIESTTILDASSISITASSIESLDCFEDNTGSISIDIQGGTAPFSIVWEPTGATGTSLTNLAAGIYSVTVTDANNCSAAAAYTISQPNEINIVLDINNVTCHEDADGSISAMVSGGAPPYTYLWDSNTGNQTTATVLGLTVGDYRVTVTDNNNCTETANASISEPPLLVLNLSSKVDVDCFGENTGEATLAVSGGTPVYSIEWSNNAGAQTGFTASGLAAGDYSATTTDANGCTATTSLSIDSPTELILTTAETTPTLCFGTPTAYARVAAQGGTPDYTYTWNAPSANFVGPEAFGLFAGDYIVTVTDDLGCTATTLVQIAEGPLLTIDIAETRSIDCFGESTGALEAIVSGGTGTYSYTWSVNTNSSSNYTVSNLGAGTYEVTVTDSNGCQNQAVYTLNEPTVLDANIDILPATQGQADGEATAQAFGGTPPYFYLWLTNPPQASPFAGGLSAGDYQLLIQDANDCETWISVNIPEVN